MSNIPCKNCILFPICKDQVISYINTNCNKPYTMPYYYVYQNILEFECGVINNWVHKSEGTIRKNIKAIQTLFTEVFKRNLLTQ